ncbi:beta-lactamase family protein [Trichomonas vaginalis G3]|uniref:Beta-lactamase family protein n=1 Tax=Trichomonas vaginalis (strain ATCC PRA-98 / G3) TaxID=412133 RepID=A2F729_TRIV3|nr:beta-lactamase family [Trichomonas vaginalis G3]EAX99266.1 beta-lactamase family protein [Trichomonas vaginalis G3]KAI5524932.1 beta-lactamase family [Trichomonas vaginalis G3]|eukprot:XP_001312196.1 beta-lactamase family protein [Trichomonas vaginalis G3]
MLFLLVNSAISETTPGGIPSDKFPDILKSIYTNYNGTYFASGAAAISYQGKKIYEDVIGYQDILQQKNATLQTLYEWGSTTKLLTHVGIMQLYEKGKVNFEEDIETYLGKGFFKHKSKNDKITILNLMHHDAGWDETIDSPILPHSTSDEDPEDSIKRMEPRSYSKPGQFVGYSNFGVAVEGLIIEKVSGVKYCDYIKQNIFDKLGMTHSSIDPSRKDISSNEFSNLASGYATVDGKLKYQDPTSVFLAPAGSCISTIGDLSIFANSITPVQGVECPLFEKNDTLELFLNNSKIISQGSPGISHGLWEEYYTNKILGLEHLGNTPGQSAVISILPKEGWNYVGFANTYADFLMTYSFHRYIWGLYTPISNNSIPNDAAGYYQNNRIVHSGFLSHITLLNSLIEIKIDASKNHILMDGYPFNVSDINLYSRSDLTPNKNVGTYHLSFTFNEKGEINGLYTYCTGFKKVPKNVNRNITIFCGIINICFFVSFVPIIGILIIACIYNKNILASKHFKYIVLTFLIAAECIAEPLVLRTTNTIKSAIHLKHNLFHVLISLYIIVSVRILCSIFTLCFLIYNYCIHRKHESIESMTVFESLNIITDEAYSGRPIPFRPNLCCSFIVFTSLFLANAISFTLIACDIIIDIYRL